MEAVGWESFALRYSSLSDVLVAGASAVAAAQLAPIASCADENRPDTVLVIPPPDSSALLLFGLLLLLGLCFFEPVGDHLSFLLSCRLADFLDDWVVCSCASTLDCSVMSSNLCAVLVSPCGGVPVPGLAAFHSVCCLPGLFLSDQSGASYVCLLYTSPSPRDRQKSRMPSSA